MLFSRELQQAETSFTDFAGLNESSVDEGSLLSRTADNIEMEEQLNAPNFDDDQIPDLVAVNGEGDIPTEPSSGSPQTDQTPSPLEASPIKQVRRTRETAPEPETRKEGLFLVL